MKKVEQLDLIGAVTSSGVRMRGLVRQKRAAVLAALSSVRAWIGRFRPLPQPGIFELRSFGVGYESLKGHRAIRTSN
jgi:hypothetical protein